MGSDPGLPLSLSASDFVLFQLPEQYEQDPALIDERRRVLQSQVHPDRFAAQGAAAQRVAMQWSTRVNEAWRRLKDPLQRAAYLCELRGVPIEAESNTRMPGAFLMQQMHWREALEESGTAAEVADLEDRVRAEFRAMQARLGELIDGGSPSTVGTNPVLPDLSAAAQQVRALMFVQRFLQDIARKAESLD